MQYEEGSSVASELRSEQEAFVAKLACALVHCSFSSEERIPVGSLYILRKGLCSRGWKFLGPGRVWGEDLILNYPQLIETTPTVALTYVEVAATSTASTLTTFFTADITTLHTSSLSFTPSIAPRPTSSSAASSSSTST